MTSSRQNNASDPVNLALNYAYGVLEGECRRAINAVGLEPSVRFKPMIDSLEHEQMEAGYPISIRQTTYTTRIICEGSYVVLEN